LQYLRARYYDPATGQFLDRDPIVSSTRDAYGYASRSPLNEGDPSGLWALDGGVDDPGNPGQYDGTGPNSSSEQAPTEDWTREDYGHALEGAGRTCESAATYANGAIAILTLLR